MVLSRNNKFPLMLFKAQLCGEGTAEGTKGPGRQSGAIQARAGANKEQG